jgi:hypothetical protein
VSKKLVKSRFSGRRSLSESNAAKRRFTLSQETELIEFILKQDPNVTLSDVKEKAKQ